MASAMKVWTFLMLHLIGLPKFRPWTPIFPLREAYFGPVSPNLTTKNFSTPNLTVLLLLHHDILFSLQSTIPPHHDEEIPHLRPTLVALLPSLDCCQSPKIHSIFALNSKHIATAHHHYTVPRQSNGICRLPRCAWLKGLPRTWGYYCTWAQNNKILQYFSEFKPKYTPFLVGSTISAVK